MTSQTTAQQWIRTKDRRTGRQLAIAVPSKSTPGTFHLTTSSTCDCRGFFYRGDCSHLRAVRAEIAARQAEAPAVAAVECGGCNQERNRRRVSGRRLSRAELSPHTCRPDASTPDTFTNAPAFDGSMAELARRQKLAAMATDTWGRDGEGS